jgi:integrase
LGADSILSHAWSAESRKRGRIEKRGNSLRVRVYAGDDPVTGRRVYRNETVRGTDRLQ